MACIGRQGCCLSILFLFFTEHSTAIKKLVGYIHSTPPTNYLAIPRFAISEGRQKAHPSPIDANDHKPEHIHACDYVRIYLRHSSYFGVQSSTLSESTDDHSPGNSHDVDDRDTMTVLVRSLSVLHRGDHVAWKRAIGIWHHAIVLDVDAVSGQLEVIHYSGGVIPDEESGGTFASVRRERVAASVRSKDLYRVDYDPQLVHCFSPEVVVERAMSRLHECEYNPLTHNCEHFARWCKTGQWRSVQVLT